MKVVSGYQVEKIIELSFFAFLGEAYKIILDRSPDMEGMKNHVKRYLEGVTKEEIVLSLVDSDEAREKQVTIEEGWRKKAKREIIENALHRKINHQNKNTTLLLGEIIDGLMESKEGQSILKIDTLSSNDYYQIDYFDFENHFRGSRELILERQEIYLPYFENCKNVLDLGCGRGEFTELLVKNGIGVVGVDMYEPYVRYMEGLNLPVVLDDACRYLRNVDSTDGVFLGQVVEHISIEKIIEICELSHEKLEEGKYLIMETPNPTSLAIYTNSFYVDPSHHKPIHPFTLQYLVQKAGFSSAEILFTECSKLPFDIPKIYPDDQEFVEFNDAMNKVAGLLYGSQDYAIIARK